MQLESEISLFDKSYLPPFHSHLCQSFIAAISDAFRIFLIDFLYFVKQSTFLLSNLKKCLAMSLVLKNPTREKKKVPKLILQPFAFKS